MDIRFGWRWLGKQQIRRLHKYPIATASTAYHLYREDWTPYAITGYYDNTLVFTYINPGMGSTALPYDQKFHLLMNVAVGGGINGVDTTAFPTSMQIDYVRFYNMIHKQQ